MKTDSIEKKNKHRLSPRLEAAFCWVLCGFFCSHMRMIRVAQPVHLVQTEKSAHTLGFERPLWQAHARKHKGQKSQTQQQQDQNKVANPITEHLTSVISLLFTRFFAFCFFCVKCLRLKETKGDQRRNRGRLLIFCPTAFFPNCYLSLTKTRE